MQEASSIAKAIEKGWDKAGRPVEFTVKVFEEPQKNFIGMTTKPAKIALFFDEAKLKRPETKGSSEESKRTIERREPVADRTRPVRKPLAPRQESRPEIRPLPTRQEPSRSETQRQESSSEVRREQIERRQPRVAAVNWSADMMQTVQEWLTQVLIILGRSDINCTVEADENLLKVNFSASILDNSSKDKLLFRSFAFLLMQLLRNKARKRLRGLKIVLTTSV
jgi:predicted RNA-binding protein Jag